jgi:hypothetical protein
VWEVHEYNKLPEYDGETVDQLMKGATGLFMCHQQDGKLCAGWVGGHGAFNLLALRLHADKVDPEVFGYRSPVPLFTSGLAAAKHGMKAIRRPGIRARAMVARLMRKQKRRNDNQ